MSDDNKKQNLNNHAGLNLLRDIFGLATCFPAILNAICESKGETENTQCDVETCKEDTACENTCDQDKKELNPDTNAFRMCKASLHYTADGLVYDIYYSGIDNRIAKDDDLFTEWCTKIYKDYFLTAYKANIEASNKPKEDAEYITRLSFEFYAEGDTKNNLAVTPWIWDNDMLTFYHEDEDGDKHYVRFFNQGGEVSVCDKNGLIVTDMISDADRQMFISTCKRTIDNLSQDGEKDDIMSYDCEDTCSGAESDYNVDEIFDDCEAEECDKRNMDADEECEKDECEETEETLGDIVCSYGYNVRNQAVRDRNVGSEYSPSVKKLYKDILYKESNVENRTLTKKEWIMLFDYMLDNKLYDYSIVSSKVVISVSYEDMMTNIDKPNYERPNAPVGSNLPWFMTPGSAPKFEPIAWKHLNKQFFANTIRDHYNFDEVVLIDMLSTDEDPLASDKHCILCTFEAM